MAISYPLTMPTTIGPAAITMRAVNTTVLSRSPFSGAQQTLSYPNEHWEADIQLSPMARQHAEEWLAFLLSLRGHVGTFVLIDPSTATPRGAASGTLLVKTATAVGDTSLIGKGAPISTTDLFLAGDCIMVNNGDDRRLFKVLADASSDGAGDFTLDVWPEMRAVHAVDEAITYTSPGGLFRLATNVATWTVEDMLFGASFSAVEVVP